MQALKDLKQEREGIRCVFQKGSSRHRVQGGANPRRPEVELGVRGLMCRCRRENSGT